MKVLLMRSHHLVTQKWEPKPKFAKILIDEWFKVGDNPIKVSTVDISSITSSQLGWCESHQYNSITQSLWPLVHNHPQAADDFTTFDHLSEKYELSLEQIKLLDFSDELYFVVKLFLQPNFYPFVKTSHIERKRIYRSTAHASNILDYLLSFQSKNELYRKKEIILKLVPNAMNLATGCSTVIAQLKMVLISLPLNWSHSLYLWSGKKY